MKVSVLLYSIYIVNLVLSHAEPDAISKSFLHFILLLLFWIIGSVNSYSSCLFEDGNFVRHHEETGENLNIPYLEFASNLSEVVQCITFKHIVFHELCFNLVLCFNLNQVTMKRNFI